MNLHGPKLNFWAQLGLKHNCLIWFPYIHLRVIEIKTNPMISLIIMWNDQGRSRVRNGLTRKVGKDLESRRPSPYTICIHSTGIQVGKPSSRIHSTWFDMKSWIHMAWQNYSNFSWINNTSNIVNQKLVIDCWQLQSRDLFCFVWLDVVVAGTHFLNGYEYFFLSSMKTISVTIRDLSFDQINVNSEKIILSHSFKW